MFSHKMGTLSPQPTTLPDPHERLGKMCQHHFITGCASANNRQSDEILNKELTMAKISLACLSMSCLERVRAAMFI